jgi:hypothetical protein
VPPDLAGGARDEDAHSPRYARVKQPVKRLATTAAADTVEMPASEQKEGT